MILAPTNVFTAYLAKHYFDEIQTLDIIDVNSGDHGYSFATNFNPEINIREVSAECRHWQDGEFVTTPPMSMKQLFSCPEDVGTYNIYRMYHEELESLTKHYPTLQRAQFWMSFSESYLKHLEVLNNIGMTSIDAIEYEGQQIVPIQFFKGATARAITAWAKNTWQNLYWLCRQWFKGWQSTSSLHLQHQRSSGLLQGSWLSGYFLHYWGACNDWR